jgi:hypothetical protein
MYYSALLGSPTGRSISPQLFKILGWIVILIGLVGLYYGPLEIYCFYMFSSLGQFNYEGFTIGSFMFAYLVAQNCIYYLVAIFLIPIGIGLAKQREWGLRLLDNLLRLIIVFSVALFATLVVPLPELLSTSNNPLIIIVVILITVFGIGLPYLLLKVFNTEKIKMLFKTDATLLSKISSTELLVITINLMLVIFLHILIFYKCIFPLFGDFALMREGIYYIAGAITVLLALTYLYFQKNIIGFWGLIMYYLTLMLSTIMTLGKYSTKSIIELLDYNDFENSEVISAFGQILNINYLPFIAVMMLLTIGLIIHSRKMQSSGRK